MNICDNQQTQTMGIININLKKRKTKKEEGERKNYALPLD